MTEHKHEYVTLPGSGETGCIQCSLDIIGERMRQVYNGTMKLGDISNGMSMFTFNVMLNLVEESKKYHL